MRGIVGQSADQHADHDRRDQCENRNGAVLAIEERHGALEDQSGDLLHRRGALILREHIASEPESKQDRDDPRQQYDRPEFHRNLLCSSYTPDDRRSRAAVKMSGMAADRAERGSWRKTYAR